MFQLIEILFQMTSYRIKNDDLHENTLLRFNQTLETYLKVSVGNDTYILTKYDKYKLQIQKFLKIRIHVVIFYRIGL